MYEYMHKYQYVITSSNDAIKSMYELNLVNPEMFR